ncbi:MAG TPA: TolC family protein, partial [Candidatus Koribacter sp.]
MIDCTATRLRKLVSSFCVYAMLASTTAFAQQDAPAAPQPQQQPQAQSAFNISVPKSHDPLGPYMPSHVSAPILSNSPRLASLIKDGKLYLSLRDAISLALENNLDLAIARYNLPIADTDILRTKAGGVFRGVNTGVVQGTPGGGVGGFGSGAPGAGAGGTTSGAGGAGAGASGLVQSTLGTGTQVNTFDPLITSQVGIEHLTSPLSNLVIYGVPSLELNTTTANVNYSQAFPTGTELSVDFNNNRQTQNSPFNNLNPTLNSMYRVTLQQQL